MQKRQKKYTEAQLIALFNLQCLTDSENCDLLQVWLNTETILNAFCFKFNR